jgi:ABC-type branched-subunit amino acid transport system substrate-binding protein
MADKRVKICPSCFHDNRPDSRRCEVCQRNLAGVVSKIPVQTSQLGILSLLPDTSSSQSLPPDYSAGKPAARRRQGRRRALFAPLGVVVGIALIIVSSFRVFGPVHGSSQKNPSSHPNVLSQLHLYSQKNPSSHPNVLSQLGEFNASNGERLGVNDGSSAPFLLGPDGQLKQQAFAALKQGHASQAVSLWRAALHITNNDAEAWIYLENQSVLLSGLPYITLVVGTDLFESSGSGLSVLQGVYVAQHEFNTGNHGFRIRILIANSGTDTTNVSVITQQIVNIAKHDKTVVGVVSWLTSNENIIAVPNLAKAHIPMIAPDAASDLLTNVSPYFLRIIAPSKVQGKQSALFVEHTLHVKKVVIFVDNSDPYSQNAAQNFEDQFSKDGNTILKIEPFITDKTSNIKSLIQDALGTKPDLLFFTSRDGSDDANFEDALPMSGPFAKLPVLAGGAGYVIHKAGYGRWYFNPDAFPDEWVNIEGNSSPPPPFYQDYSNDFNEDGLQPPGAYGYTRPNSDTMLSYDVASVFLKAIQTLIASNKVKLTADGIQDMTPELLAQTLPHVALQGVSGWIAFDPRTGNPINKAFVFLAVSPDGHTYMKDWLGCFTQTLCRNVS